MAPTRILLLPANVAPTTSTPRYLVSAPIQETRPVSTRVTAASRPRPTASRPQMTPKMVDPLAILNPPTSTKPRKRERLTSLTVEEKLNRRKLKNRMAAQTARDRKKERSSGLEDCVRQLLEENKKLQAENNALHNRLATLEQTASRRDAEVEELRRALEDQRNARVSPSSHSMFGVETAAALESAEGSGIGGLLQPSNAQRDRDASSHHDTPAHLDDALLDDLEHILEDLKDIDVDAMCAALEDEAGSGCEEKHHPENDHVYALASPSGSTDFEGSFAAAASAVSPSMDMEWDMASSSFSPSSLIMADPLLCSPSNTIPFRDYDDYEETPENRMEPSFDDPFFEAFPSYPDHRYGAAF